MVGVRLTRYESLGESTKGQPAELIQEESDFLAYQWVVGNDTIDLKDWDFEPSTRTLRVSDSGSVLTWKARRGRLEATLEYSFSPNRYLFDVAATLSGPGVERGFVLVGLGPRISSVEADSTLDFRSYGVVTKARSTENLKFSSLDFGEVAELSGPFEWVAVKSKYFVAGVFALEEDQPQFGGAIAVGGELSGRSHTRAHVRASLPAPGGQFRHSVYFGPQEYRRLHRVGHEFEDVNPYGWILRPIIRPFAIAIVQVLIWMHENLKLAYGWVLILFGLAVRVLLWPLNQKAMKSSIAMQAIQPEVKALQERYKSDPQKLQQEMMKLYKEHGVNPLGGCLPMLLPMPILFALFFVFANTIEFRGVPFLWLPDLSAADPYYIIPLMMGASMFLLSWIGQRGMPPNPQAKMMMYVFPVVLTIMFLRFSSGLNLYYAVSNIASLPQQWLIAKERRSRQAKK